MKYSYDDMSGQFSLPSFLVGLGLGALIVIALLSYLRPSTNSDIPANEPLSELTNQEQSFEQDLRPSTNSDIPTNEPLSELTNQGQSFEQRLRQPCRNELVVNASFEEPFVANGEYLYTVPEAIPGWESDMIIELMGDGHRELDSYAGRQHAELNTNQLAALSQTVATEAGAIIYWSFAHRGRHGFDEVALLAGTSPGQLLQVATYRTGQEWVVYEGYYEVPSEQTETVFQWAALASHNNRSGHGNLIDAITLCVVEQVPISVPVFVPDLSNLPPERPASTQPIADAQLLNQSDCANELAVNASFEFPVFEPNSSQHVLPKDIPGWNSNMVLEIMADGHRGIDAYRGRQLAELNAWEPAAMTQTVETVPGSTIEWSFAHRGRHGVDELRFLVGVSAEQVVEVLTARTGTEWMLYSGEYEVPIRQFETTFQWEAVASAEDRAGQGNLLDAISLCVADTPSANQQN